MIDSYLERLRNIRDGIGALADLHKRMHSDLSEIILHLKDYTDDIDEEMKKFKEGFAYERPKTPSSPRKKPVLHGVEFKRNKRKSNKVSKYADSSL